MEKPIRTAIYAQCAHWEPVAISVVGTTLTAPAELGSFDTPNSSWGQSLLILRYFTSAAELWSDTFPSVFYFGVVRLNGVTDYTFSNGDGIFSLVFLVEGASGIPKSSTNKAPLKVKRMNLSITANQVSYNVGDMPTCEDLCLDSPFSSLKTSLLTLPGLQTGFTSSDTVSMSSKEQR